ncbi:hypothetical protein BC938DRAFT_474187 [Jimgerdemannia flammicorona]|uniref:NF-X1-type domain-containing protein n=1 Tax=Jimgerdemannia flammicorona TaxID=994334 RepID=A0A433QSP6_9FUNG|nr:hypothetical protein BC938DRAFT_474187 [Jimgerdemannia flammicorona]
MSSQTQERDIHREIVHLLRNLPERASFDSYSPPQKFRRNSGVPANADGLRIVFRAVNDAQRNSVGRVQRSEPPQTSSNRTGENEEAIRGRVSITGNDVPRENSKWPAGREPLQSLPSRTGKQAELIEEPSSTGQFPVRSSHESRRWFAQPIVQASAQAPAQAPPQPIMQAPARITPPTVALPNAHDQSDYRRRPETASSNQLQALPQHNDVEEHSPLHARGRVHSSSPYSTSRINGTELAQHEIPLHMIKADITASQSSPQTNTSHVRNIRIGTSSMESPSRSFELNESLPHNSQGKRKGGDRVKVDFEEVKAIAMVKWDLGEDYDCDKAENGSVKEERRSFDFLHISSAKTSISPQSAPPIDQEGPEYHAKHVESLAATLNARTPDTSRETSMSQSQRGAADPLSRYPTPNPSVDALDSGSYLINSGDDNEVSRFLIKFQGLSPNAQVQELHAAGELIRKISRVSYRNFALLVSVLSSHQMMKGRDSTMLDVLDALSTHLTEFLETAVRHLKTSINSSEEYMPLLKLFWLFVTKIPDRAQVIPTDVLNDKLEEIQDKFDARETKAAKGLLREMRTVQMAKDRSAVISQSTKSLPTARPLTKKPVDGGGGDVTWIREHQSMIYTTPILPSLDEISQNDPPTHEKMHANLATVPWPADRIDVYLDTHFSLLRAEIVDPLRQSNAASIEPIRPRVGVARTLSRPNALWFVKLRAISSTLGYGFEPVVRFRFRVSRLLDDFETYFQHGSLVALFMENERDSVTFAVVRELLIDNNDETSDEKQGVVGLHFSQEQFTQLELNASYECFESLPNFVALEPVLQWLKSAANNFQNSTAAVPSLLTSLLTVRDFSGQLPQNDKLVPEYLFQRKLDISCIMKSAFKGTRVEPGEIWPEYLGDNRQQIYNISFSQMEAVRHVLANRVAVVAGAPGTGKTFLAAKIVQLLHQALKDGQFYQPILVIADTAAGLDDILSTLLPTIPDFVRFGPFTDNVLLWDRQIHAVAESREDNGKRHHQQLITEMLAAQTKLAYLWQVRIQAQSDEYFINSIPHQYLGTFLNTGDATRHRGRAELLKSCLSEWLDYPPKRSRNTSGRVGARRKARSVSEQIDSSGDSDNERRSHGCAVSDVATLRLLNQDTAMNYVDEHLILCDDPSNYERRRKRIIRLTGNPDDDRVKNPKIPKELVEIVWKNVPPNLWSLSLPRRKQIRQDFTNKALHSIDEQIGRSLNDLYRLYSQLDDLRKNRWIARCRFARVIGMTATFATTYRELIQTLDPRVCVVDSARMMEAQLMSCLISPKTEHVVLIGDTCSDTPQVYNRVLATDFKLDVSLLKRWIQSGGKYVELKQQYRMSLPISSLVAPFYDRLLEQHLSPSKFPNVLGVDSNTFFFSHKRGTKDGSYGIHGISDWEGQLVARFAFYLWQQGYDPSEITILTQCIGQKKVIVDALHPRLISSPSAGGKGTIVVETASAYRGRENIIVIVSMASGNCSEEHGMLLGDQRVVLPLSRAQHGLYIFGDGQNLKRMPGWDQIIETFTAQELISERIKVHCQNHPERRRVITSAKDFDEIPDGGCTEPCKTLLDCGHVCPKLCHQQDHSLIKCERDCLRPRLDRCTHKCPKKCHECEQRDECPPCEEEVTMTLPCQHQFKCRCNALPSNLESPKCHNFVEYRLPCGHVKNIECFKKQNRDYTSRLVCTAQETRSLACGHEVLTICGRLVVCPEKCEQKLPCGHPCMNQGAEILTTIRIGAWKNARTCARMATNVDVNAGNFALDVCRIALTNARIISAIGTVMRNAIDLRAIDGVKRDLIAANHKSLYSHTCFGLCGEPCPPCKSCCPEIQCSISLRTLGEFDEVERMYKLPECGCGT